MINYSEMLKMTLDEVISYNRYFVDIETKSGDLEVAEYYRNTTKCLEELKELIERKAEYKRLLKAAVEDLRLVKECQCCKHRITGYADVCYGCHFNTNKWEWQYTDEFKKLTGDEPNGI